MRYISFIHEGRAVLGLKEGGKIHVLGNELLDSLLARGVDLAEYGRSQPHLASLDPSQVKTYLPPLIRPPKIFCVGLNYADHTKESKYDQPEYPTIFPRYHSSLVAHQEPIIRPLASDSLDFEGEMAVVLIGGGRYIAKENALRWVAGYSVFNDGSVREYQFKSPQWTIGKNFDNTGAFGPELVTADELPPGGRGLTLETRLNGELVQSASTDDMLFDVATLISVLSEAISLEAGDVIVTGTPSGIGWARNPRLLMRHGDVCEVSISQIGTLKNPIEDER
ncbi:MAG: fumarylacetoacetate hydrolase family protein [Burkholderiaceae bacterium]